MTRQEEANLLRAMKGDTYFAQYFGDSDIEQMAQNVEKDFPIELECIFNKKADVLKKEIAKLKNEHKQELLNICQKLIKKIDMGFDEDGIYQVVEEAIGKDAIIKYKHKESIDFTDEELSYLVSKL